MQLSSQEKCILNMRKGKSMVIKKEKDASSALGEETFKRMIVWIDVKIDTCHRMKKIQVFFIDQVKHLLIIFSSFPPSTIYRRIPNHFSFSRVHWIYFRIIITYIITQLFLFFTFMNFVPFELNLFLSYQSFFAKHEFAYIVYY